MLPGGAATVFYVPVASTGQGVVSAAFAGEVVLKKRNVIFVLVGPMYGC